MTRTLITCWSSGSVCQVFCCAVSSCSSLAFNSFLPSAAAAKSLQSCPALCDPIDGSQPGSPVPGILQARTLEWVAISFSKAWKWKVKVKSLICVRLLATPWTAAYQAPPSMGFSRQEYWSGVPLPSPTGLWDECNCAVVWALPFFGILMKTDLFQSCGHCWVFQICWRIEYSTSHSIIFQDLI